MAQRSSSSKKVVVGLEVKLEVITKDKKRKFAFGLKKTKTGTLDEWHMSFVLSDREKATDAFAQAILLEVDLDLAKAPKAKLEATADKGLSPQQIAFITTSVADASEKFKRGEIDEAEMDRVLHRLIRVRK